MNNLLECKGKAHVWALFNLFAVAVLFFPGVINAHNTALSSPFNPETLSAGRLHTCGLKTDGTLACWGYEPYGLLNPPPGTFTQVSAGDFHNCGLKTNGTVACWGWTGYDQATPPTGTFTQVSAGH